MTESRDIRNISLLRIEPEMVQNDKDEGGIALKISDRVDLKDVTVWRFQPWLMMFRNLELPLFDRRHSEAINSQTYNLDSLA
jgi:hypothetical protein